MSGSHWNKYLVAGLVLLATLSCRGMASPPAAPTQAPTPAAAEPTLALDPAPPLSPATSPAPPAPGLPAGATAPAAVTSTPTPTVSTTGEPTRRSVPQGPLTSAGPWLLIPARDGLWIVNADGSGLKRLAEDRRIDLEKALSPDGKQLAYVRDASGGALSELELVLLRLPEGEAQVLTSLLPDVLPQPFEIGTDAFEAARAIFEFSPPVWSPDGSRLAFIGAQDGPSADLYVYQLSDGKILRLTDGPSQGYAPSWSPDGKWIVQTGASQFGTGAGYDMEGIWAASANDSRPVVTLYDLNKLGWATEDEQVRGWLSPDLFLVNSWDARCGAKDLRAASITTGKVQMIWPYSLMDPSLALDPSSGAMMFQVLDDPECNGNNPGGVYWAALGGPAKQVSAAAGAPTWSREGGLFLVQGDNVVHAYTPDGEPVPVAGDWMTWPVTYPGGSEWAASGDYFANRKGLWVGPLAGPLRQVSGEFVRSPVWAPDGSALFAFTGEDPKTFRGPGLLVAYPPELILLPVSAQVELDGEPVWAGLSLDRHP